VFDVKERVTKVEKVGETTRLRAAAIDDGLTKLDNKVFILEHDKDKRIEAEGAFQESINEKVTVISGTQQHSNATNQQSKTVKQRSNTVPLQQNQPETGPVKRAQWQELQKGKRTSGEDLQRVTRQSLQRTGGQDLYTETSRKGPEENDMTIAAKASRSGPTQDVTATTGKGVNRTGLEQNAMANAEKGNDKNVTETVSEVFQKIQNDIILLNMPLVPTKTSLEEGRWTRHMSV
jgi:hypothetical protein